MNGYCGLKKKLEIKKMHELAVSQNILEACIKEAEKEQGRRIKKIKLKIGEFTGIVPDCIKFYFEQISKETLAKDAELIIKTLPLKVKCKKCCKTSNISEPYFFICPQCQAQDLEIISGKELLIESIDLE